jgi:hypothetical protein
VYYRHAERSLPVQLCPPSFELVSQQKRDRRDIERVLCHILYLPKRYVAEEPTGAGDTLEVVETLQKFI